MTSELIVITYPTADDAERVVDTVRRLESEHLLDIAEIVYVTRDLNGVVDVHPSIHRPLVGAARGAFWASLLGKVFGAPLLGAGSLIAGQRPEWDEIDERFVRDLTTGLPAGSSAVFSLVRRSTPGEVLPALAQSGGTVLHTSLSQDVEDQLQADLDDAQRNATRVLSATLTGERQRPRRVMRHA
jgi:uncharacterized membrane protein